MFHLSLDSVTRVGLSVLRGQQDHFPSRTVHDQTTSRAASGCHNLPRNHGRLQADDNRRCNTRLSYLYAGGGLNLILFLYLYSAQYLHVLQDSEHYITHPTAQIQTNSPITDIPLTERQRLKDDHLSTSLRFFNLPLGIGPNDRGPPF